MPAASAHLPGLHAAPTSGVDGRVAPAPELPPVPAAAHQAVEAVLNAVDRLVRHNEHAVNLRFEIGGSDLSVHVELRGEQVHTTFRTDSAELRATLAGEWQTLTNGPGSERSARLAPAVFTSNDQASNRFSSDTPTPQRDPEAYRPDQAPARFTSRFSAGSVAPDVAAAVLADPSPAGAVHLHTRA